MNDFGTLTLDQAKAYCEAYVSGLPERIEWLRSELARTGGPVDALDASRDALVPLWSWLLGQVGRSEEGTPAGRPAWHSATKGNPYLSDRDLWLIDAAGSHLAELVRTHVAAARWDVYRPPGELRDVNQNRTMLHGLPGRPADPIQMVYGEVIGRVLHGESEEPAALVRIFDFMTQDADEPRSFADAH